MTNIDDIIERIKKALRLAQKAGTDGERDAAERAAKRLADTHGIDLSRVTVTDSEAKATMRNEERRYRRVGAEVGFTVSIIRKHFGVVVMLNYLRGEDWMQLTFFGVNINIEVSKYVYDILIREVNRAWKEAKGWGLDKRSFMTGWFAKIDQKLTEHPLRNDREQFEAEKEAAERKFKEYQSNPDNNIKFSKVKSDSKDAEALYRGFRSAEKVNLSRPCEGQASASPFSLGHTKQLKEAM